MTPEPAPRPFCRYPESGTHLAKATFQGEHFNFHLSLLERTETELCHKFNIKFYSETQHAEIRRRGRGHRRHGHRQHAAVRPPQPEPEARGSKIRGVRVSHV